MRTLRLFAFLFSKPVGRRQFEESPIIGIKMLKTLLKMLKNQHNFEYFCFGYSASVLCSAVSATMGLHGSVWRFTTVWVSGAYLWVSWLCALHSACAVWLA